MISITSLCKYSYLYEHLHNLFFAQLIQRAPTWVRVPPGGPQGVPRPGSGTRALEPVTSARTQLCFIASFSALIQVSVSLLRLSSICSTFRARSPTQSITLRTCSPTQSRTLSAPLPPNPVPLDPAALPPTHTVRRRTPFRDRQTATKTNPMLYY